MPAGLPAPSRPAPGPHPEPQAGTSALPGRPLPVALLSARSEGYSRPGDQPCLPLASLARS